METPFCRTKQQRNLSGSRIGRRTVPTNGTSRIENESEADTSRVVCRTGSPETAGRLAVFETGGEESELVVAGQPSEDDVEDGEHHEERE